MVDKRASVAVCTLPGIVIRRGNGYGVSTRVKRVKFKSVFVEHVLKNHRLRVFGFVSRFKRSIRQFVGELSVKARIYKVACIRAQDINILVVFTESIFVEGILAFAANNVLVGFKRVVVGIHILICAEIVHFDARHARTRNVQLEYYLVIFAYLPGVVGVLYGNSPLVIAPFGSLEQQQSEFPVPYVLTVVLILVTRINDIDVGFKAVRKFYRHRERRIVVNGVHRVGGFVTELEMRAFARVYVGTAICTVYNGVFNSARVYAYGIHYRNILRFRPTEVGVDKA